MFKSVKGTRDILPPESGRWSALERTVRTVMDLYRYQEIRTPVFEETSIFARGIGEDTDIVGKEMYTFVDKGGTSLTLRPEMTASVVRAYIQHNLAEQAGLHKLFYIGPMFRQERPQAGRFRQFHQFGCENIGSSDPATDAEVIGVAADVYRSLGVGATLKINSVGDPTCRPRYRAALQDFLRGVEEQLTAESRRRLETNPLRILDSKAEQDRHATASAPSIIDYLSDESRSHFEEVKRLLRDMDIPFEIDTRLVRGLDYYTKTAFEFVSDELGSQDALGGGGRYDGLAEQLGGRNTPAVGFAAGIERLLIVLEKRGHTWEEADLPAFFIGLDDESRRWSFSRTIEFRRAGIAAECDFSARSLKAQMREANRQRARHAVIVGDQELERGVAAVKDMRTGEQVDIAFTDLLSYFKKLQLSQK